MAQEKGMTNEEITEKFYNPEEQIDGNYEPIANLPKLENILTGEQNQDVIFQTRAKLYKFREKQWKERGKGNAKLLRHKNTKKIRFLLRQDGTRKVVGNFLLEKDPLCELKPLGDDSKCFGFMAVDYSQNEAKQGNFSIRFANIQSAQSFQNSWSAARVFNEHVEKGQDDKLVWAEVIPQKEKEKQNQNAKQDKKKIEDDEKKAIVEDKGSSLDEQKKSVVENKGSSPDEEKKQDVEDNKEVPTETPAPQNKGEEGKSQSISKQQDGNKEDQKKPQSEEKDSKK